MLNQDFMCQPGSMIAKQMPMDTFKQKITQLLMKNPDSEFDASYPPTCDEDYTYIFEDMEGSGLTWPCIINPENVSTQYYHPNYIIGKPLLGFETLSNGVPVFAVFCGSDYSMAIIVLLYPDDKENIQVYVPIKGNAINVNDHRVLFEESPTVFDTETQDIAYVQKYGYTPKSAVIDCDAMRKELNIVMKVI